MITFLITRVERGGQPVLGASVQADITGPGGRLQHLRLEVTLLVMVVTMMVVVMVVTKMVVMVVMTKMLVMMIISNKMLRTQAAGFPISLLATAPTQRFCQKWLPGFNDSLPMVPPTIPVTRVSEGFVGVGKSDKLTCSASAAASAV